MTTKAFDPHHPAGRVFFTADTHFGHRGSIDHSGRPFRDVKEMDRLMIDAWNATVGPRDTIYHLGDFAYKASPERCAEIFAKLNGRKVLIKGNHDHRRTLVLPWDSIHERLKVHLGGHRIILDHYPMRSWDGAYHGSLHLHGHVHGAFSGTSQSCDAGVDVWGYRPTSLEEILVRIKDWPLPEERLRPEGDDGDEDDAE